MKTTAKLKRTKTPTRPVLPLINTLHARLESIDWEHRRAIIGVVMPFADTKNAMAESVAFVGIALHPRVSPRNIRGAW